MLPYDKRLSSNAKVLRRNMTKEEKTLWFTVLKKLPMNVYRQRVIKEYIVDFYIPKKKLVIEIDGLQHGLEANSISDSKRDLVLNSLGITVARYTNQDINKNLNSVVEDLLNKLNLTFKEVSFSDI